jgi:hypothetical protein
MRTAKGILLHCKIDRLTVLALRRNPSAASGGSQVTVAVRTPVPTASIPSRPGRLLRGAARGMACNAKVVAYKNWKQPNPEFFEYEPEHKREKVANQVCVIKNYNELGLIAAPSPGFRRRPFRGPIEKSFEDNDSGYCARLSEHNAKDIERPLETSDQARGR